MTTDDVGLTGIHFDLAAIKEEAQKGVRRAAAFMGYAVKTTEGSPLSSLTIPALVVYHFIPDPLPPELAENAQREYRIWVLGNCLAELDQFFARFLDELWVVCQFSEQVPTGLTSSFRPEPNRVKSSSSKYEALLKFIGAYDADAQLFKPALHSLTLGRNCLLHDSGRVSRRSTHGADILAVQWYRFETQIRYEDGHIIVLNDENHPPCARDFEASIVSTLILNSVAVEVGCVLQFSTQNLTEICLFYQILIERVLDAVVKRLIVLGVVAAPAVARNEAGIS